MVLIVNHVFDISFYYYTRKRKNMYFLLLYFQQWGKNYALKRKTWGQIMREARDLDGPESQEASNIVANTDQLNRYFYYNPLFSAALSQHKCQM